jgi:hypothetical protein
MSFIASGFKKISLNRPESVFPWRRIALVILSIVAAIAWSDSIQRIVPDGVYYWAIFLLPGLVMGVGSGASGHSAKRRIASLLSSTLSLVLVLWLLLVAAFIDPVDKDDCPWGAWNCTHSARYFLVPIMLWSHAALHLIQVDRRDVSEKKWVTASLLNGVIMYLIWFLLDFTDRFSRGRSYSSDAFFDALLVGGPALVLAVWYFVLLRSRYGGSGQLQVALKSLLYRACPFWLLVWLESWAKYSDLPQTYNEDCFVVGAATRGHEAVVGPYTFTERRGVLRKVNRQLLVFWRFEEVWQASLPFTHQIFRSLYNRLGPLIARRMRNPFVADAVYLLLKPFEYMAAKLVSDLHQP